MRFTFLVLALTALFSCARTALEPTPLECGDGYEWCGPLCVPAGTCQAAGAGGAGGSGGSTTTPIVCNDVASLQRMMTTRYDGALLPVTGSSKQYYVHTNWWYQFDGQTVDVDGLSYTLGNPAGATSGSDMPMGYPSFFIGSYSGHTTQDSNLPKQVSALTEVPTILATNASRMGTSNYNAAYDVWFTAGSAPLSSGQYSPGAGGAYLMVWLFKPSDRQPRGSIGAASTTVPGLPGKWDVWIDWTNPACISYVSTTPIERLDFDLNRVIQDSVENSYGITSSMYLSIIFAGFEVWGGGDGLELQKFCAEVR